MATQTWMAAAASVLFVAALELSASPLGIFAAAGLLAVWGATAHRRLITELIAGSRDAGRPAVC